VRLLLSRRNCCSCVMLDRLFVHPKMRCRLTAAPLIEGGAAERRNQMRWYYLAARSH
jgi:hypothetical protein